jgi:adenylosuccinate synthase
LGHCQPVYKQLPGWKRSTCGVTSFKKLPDKARRYVDYISGQLNAPVFMISTGNRRDQTIIL